MWENLFVLSVLAVSGRYIVMRLWRMSQASKNKESACGSCASATCSSAQPLKLSTNSGETPLRLKT